MNCPECGSEIKTVPAGISTRTGKPYDSFQACSNRECKWKPPQETPRRETRPLEVHKNGFNDDFGFKCNALNNATLLYNEILKQGSTYTKTELEIVYNDMLEILKK